MITGVWDVYEKPKTVVKLYFFKKQNKQTIEKVQKMARKLGRFVTGAADVNKIQMCPKMVPLPERTAGSMMTPLKDC